MNCAGVNGTRICYEMSGDGPAVALIHGFSLDLRMWDDQVSDFARRYRLIRYDARGFGRSAVPGERQYSHAEDLKRLLEHLGIRAVALIGLSMGGRFAMEFARRFPDATTALVLVDSALDGYEYHEPLSALMDTLSVVARRDGVPAARELWLSSELFQSLMKYPLVAERLRHIVQDYSGWHWLNHDPVDTLHPLAIRRLSDVSTPALAVVGEHDLPDFHTIAEKLHREIPHARKVVMKDVGHMSNMENPLGFNRAILDFLDEVVSNIT